MDSIIQQAQQNASSLGAAFQETVSTAANRVNSFSTSQYWNSVSSFLQPNTSTSDFSADAKLKEENTELSNIIVVKKKKKKNSSSNNIKKQQKKKKKFQDLDRQSVRYRPIDDDDDDDNDEQEETNKQVEIDIEELELKTKKASVKDEEEGESDSSFDDTSSLLAKPHGKEAKHQRHHDNDNGFREGGNGTMSSRISSWFKQSFLSNIVSPYSSNQTTSTTIQAPNVDIETTSSPSSSSDTNSEKSGGSISHWFSSRYNSFQQQWNSRFGTQASSSNNTTDSRFSWIDRLFGHSSDSFLTSSNRRWGFVICLAIGIVTILGSLLFLPYLLVPLAARSFAFFYSLGNVFCLISTFFLVGPIKQIQLMMSPDRIIPSIMYMLSMSFTLLLVVQFQSIIFVFIFLLVQAVSLAWYIISYIPYAQQLLCFFLRTTSSQLI